MTTRTATKFLGLTLGAVLSIACLSTVVFGMQSAATPAVRTIELPTVVVVGPKTAAIDATAMATTKRVRKA